LCEILKEIYKYKLLEVKMARKNIFIIKKRENDGTYTVIYLDYKFLETNKTKIFKIVEKLLKQKIKKEGRIHNILEEKIDLIDVDIDIYQIVLN
jgi:hypothetical protein